MEFAKEVKALQVDYECPKCKTGKLRPSGSCLTTSPPMYPHKCTDCDYCETFIDKMYPYIIYERREPLSTELAKFCKKISQQKDCPQEIIDIVNKEFWNLI